MEKKYKIFSTCWHVMHYFDLANALKDQADFYLCTNTWREWRDPRFLAVRPIPKNVSFVPYYEKEKYDFAILSVDQQLANPDIGKRKIYTQFRKTIGNDIPVITINHGSPVYPEFLKQEEMTDEDAQIECIKEIKELVKGSTMVTNSYTAVSMQEWGFGYPIRHGINKDDWWDLPKEPKVCTALSPGGCDAYYNRECMNEVANILHEKYGYNLLWARVNIKTDDTLESYKEFLGRSLIYIDTSFRTPLNRGRTEAMLSGCCVIQIKGKGKYKAHDLDYFAKDRENIILTENNPNEIVKIIIDLIEKNYDKAIKIGQAGKKTAIEKFNYAKYKNEWLKLIGKICK